MSLARHFAGSKKINLSSEQLKAGNNTKKMREDSSTTSFSEKNDVFLEGLKSDDCCTILANCFKNIKLFLCLLYFENWNIQLENGAIFRT